MSASSSNDLFITNSESKVIYLPLYSKPLKMLSSSILGSILYGAYTEQMSQICLESSVRIPLQSRFD